MPVQLVVQLRGAALIGAEQQPGPGCQPVAVGVEEGHAQLPLVKDGAGPALR